MRLQAWMERRSQLTLPFDARSELHRLRRSASPSCAATTLVAALLAVATAAPLRADDLASPDAYEIVAAATVPVLPQPIRGFLEAHVEAVRQGAIAGIDSASDAFPGGAQRHYVMLDVAAKGRADRHEAALRFPHDQTAAERLFKHHGVHKGGLLPWVLRDQYRALVRALVATDREAIARNAGVLLHLATDASLPFNTTAHREAGFVGWHEGPTAGTPAAAGLPQSARHRLHVGLIRYLQERLAYEVRVWPGRFDPATDPLEAVFDILLDSHKALEALVHIDAQVMADLAGEKGDLSETPAEAYYKRAAERAATILESRLEKAAVLSANLIGGAWVEAGRPPLNVLTTTGSAPAERTPASTPESAPFVGSRNSTVFHTAACPHVLRIKRENLVWFRTAKEARAAGRTPCKTCRPNAD